MDTKRKEIVDKLLEEIVNAKNYTEREMAVRSFSMFVDALKNSPIEMKRAGSMKDGTILMYLKTDKDNIVFATSPLDLDCVEESVEIATGKLLDGYQELMDNS